MNREFQDVPALRATETQQLHMVSLDELDPSARGDGASVLKERLSLFSSVKAKVSAIVGNAEATVGELVSLKEGAVLTLDREVDAPIDLWVEGRLVARGQLSVVGDQFAVRVTEVVRARPE